MYLHALQKLTEVFATGGGKVQAAELLFLPQVGSKKTQVPECLWAILSYVPYQRVASSCEQAVGAARGWQQCTRLEQDPEP